MVQVNKDERVWVCFEMARVQTAHVVQRLWPNCWPVRRVTTINSFQYKPGFSSVRNFQHSFANIVLFSLAFYEFGDICNHSLNHADVIDFTR